jgi:hypothetical protein
MSEPAKLSPRPDDRPGPKTGDVVDDRYQLLDVLGEGGFATVYAAHDRRIKGPVAVKILKNWCGPKEHRRFEIEVVISGRIVHPHVLRMTDAGTYNGRPYAVSPRLAGRPLSAHRGEPWRNVALYMRQYLEGMRALHEASAFVDPDHRTRVLHRDIKPDNCIVSPEGHVTIIDLGVIKPLDLKLRATTVGALVGSTAYMAPEYLFGFARATERSDVYSLGVSFFEMLTGELPYVGLEPEDFYKELAGRREARSVRELKPDLPLALAALVQNAMAPLPVNRPATVADMLDMLETILVRTGGWGLGFGPRVAIPPSIDPPAADPPPPQAPPPTPLSVLVAAPAAPPVVDAPAVDAPAVDAPAGDAPASVVDAPAAPPCDDAAPTPPPKRAAEAPAAAAKPAAAPAAPPVVDAPAAVVDAPAAAPPRDRTAPTLPPKRAASAAPPATAAAKPAAAPAAPPAPAAKPASPTVAKKRPSPVSRPVFATCAAAVLVGVGAFLFSYVLPPSSEHATDTRLDALDLAEQDVDLAEPAAPPPIDEPAELAAIDVPAAGDIARDDAPAADLDVAGDDAQVAAVADQPERPASRPKKTRPPATLTADAVSDVMKGAAADLRACAGAPRGWVKFVVQVGNGRATLQALGLNEPNTCARKAVAALRFPAGAGEFRGSLRL